jgi:hypothetical protein
MMSWDLGIVGLGVLLALSLGFGVFAQLVFWGRRARWVWLAATAASFVMGLLISEVWFGWATEADLQPNIDGLSFDEVLIGFLVGVPIVLAARWLAGRADHREGTPRGHTGQPI